MKRMKPSNIDEKMLEKIISAAYGSASIFERIEIFLLTKKDQEAKRLFDDYKKTADEVHSLKKEELPGNVWNNVKEKIDEDIKIKEEKTFLSDLTNLIIFKPQVSLTAAVVLVAVITFSIFTRNGRPEPQYSQTEIETATEQTKQALALVSNLLLSAETTLTKEIIPNRVIKPVNESFNYVNKFMRGEKNETIN